MSKRRWLVTWQIDVEEVETAREAAEKAFEIMQREGTEATSFLVYLWPTANREGVEVDLSEPPE